MLLLALGLRLYGVGFGLPALNDPDEPLFMMTALEMLRDHSLNPGWFGHPATVLFYCLAVISFLVGAIGIATGRFADADAFVGAVYADPGILFLPGRLLIVACGVACVFLTYKIGTRIADRRMGTAAAALLAINALHVEYSQIIRTDMLASMFMLLCTLGALEILRDGRPRDYVLAGICAGLACATKWPAAVILLSPVCAGLARMAHDPSARAKVVLLAATALGTLALASPFLLLDYPTVLQNLAGEARPTHPGASGSGFVANLVWYATHPLLGTLGIGGLVLALLGIGSLARREPARAAVLPGYLAFLIVITAQALVWERWLVPLLPLIALGIAHPLLLVRAKLCERPGLCGRALSSTLAALIAVPMLISTWTGAQERSHDTRQIAAQWIRTHVPAGSTILVEHAAFDLLDGPWTLLFPVGSAGCVDVGRTLGARVRYSRVEKLRSGRPIVDLGNIDPAKLYTCRSDYAVLSHYARYLEDRAANASQLGQYRALIRRGQVRAVIRPVGGHSGGPEIVIVQRALPAVPTCHDGHKYPGVDFPRSELAPSVVAHALTRAAAMTGREQYRTGIVVTPVTTTRNCPRRCAVRASQI